MMKVTLAFILFMGVAFAAYTEQEYQTAFTNWMQEQKKAYAADEFKLRYSIFQHNMDFVASWNADPSHTHTVELNKFADLSVEEYRQTYLMKKVDFSEQLAAAADLPEVPMPQGDTVNWVNKGAVTPIKNQGQCGSCWSFSTTGSIEGITHITTNTLPSLSEQNLVDCSGSYGNDGCNGGLPTQAMQYVINNKGIDLEDSYPAYCACQGKCRYNAQWNGAIITGFTNVQSGSESDLVAKINMQPVSVAIDASNESFQLYKDGIYNEPACSTTSLDHAVLAVGYGTSTGDYYLVKNSWGTTWGIQGYIQMSRNKNNQCGIATSAAIPTGASLPSSTSASANSAATSATSGQSSSSGSSSASGKTASSASSGQTSSASSGQASSASSGQTSSSASSGQTASSASSGQTASSASSGQTASSASSSSTK